MPIFIKSSSGSRSSPGIFFAPSSLASGRCFRTWVLVTYQFNKPSLFLRSFASTNAPLPLIFGKLVGMSLLFYFDSHCPSGGEYSSLSLSSAAVLFTSLTLNALFMIWCSGKTALFLSFLAKAALAYLPTVLFVTLRQPFSFQQAQYVQVFALKPAPSCELLALVGSTYKSATSL